MEPGASLLASDAVRLTWLLFIADCRCFAIRVELSTIAVSVVVRDVFASFESRELLDLRLRVDGVDVVEDRWLFMSDSDA